MAATLRWGWDGLSTTYWFIRDRTFRRWLFGPAKEGWTDYYPFREWLNSVRCRYQGHPGGVVFYRAYGSEPDMTCKGCGDDLG